MPVPGQAAGSSRDPAAIRAALRAQALAEGFDAVGFAPAALADATRENLAQFLKEGRHGGMGWLAEKADRRGDPRVLWPDARSIMVLGLNYGPDEDPLSVLAQKDRAGISVYARHRDYHDVVKKKLKRLGRWVAETYATEIKVFVDTAPVMEKPLAQAGGIGWQGKHTNLVSRELGSWLFLGEIYLALDLPSDAPEIDHCGSCRACLDACPTGAFPAPYQLDARRCISYLTIEHAGPIPRDFRRAMGNRIYGCDDCLAVCPWNKFAAIASEAQLAARDDLRAPALADLVALDDAGFRALFSGSPIKRIGRDRFIRNVLIAIANSGEPALLPAVERLLGDASPIVRGAAIWALRQLAPARWSAMAQAAIPFEHDSSARSEWLA
ncbi:epoxyqueuosine reductase [Dongia mobilis]|uniref:Epoxyqueuosine reductase n=1 Tax=Dongia mobilis TaxID=578943 RepID=A0A4R6WXN9_9PROT|nr:tRNA epoxyqueuosine(34) reductase QueG [Dongia mobilis]TDQ82375.1 epoxyqueuosine reductase [Dongia mobilis]